MPAPGFGYSAGDFIATIELIAKVIKAFKDSGGASTEYRQVVQELETILQLLQHIGTIQSTGSNFAHVSAIKGVALSVQIPLREFLSKITKRYGSLARSQQKTGGMSRVYSELGAVGAKTKWAVVMDKDIAKLRADIGSGLLSILLLLNINHLEATSSVGKLAGEIQTALASKDAELQQELVSHRETMDSRLSQHADVISDVKINIEDLTSTMKINMDRLGAIERRQGRNSVLLRQFLEFMRSTVISLRCVLPVIFELLCKLILSNLQLYTLLLNLHTTISQAPTMLLSDNIHFEDVLGRTSSLPFQYFHKWKVFKAFLKSEFENRPGEQNVRHGQYLIGNAKFENLLIGKREWEGRVLPGSHLNMSVVIGSLQRKKGSCPKQQCLGKSKSCGRLSPFFVCSECGLKYTDKPEPKQPRIVDLGNMSSTKAKSLDGARDERLPNQQGHRSEQSGGKADKLRQQGELRNRKKETRRREASEILNFKRIYISTSTNAKVGTKSSEVDPEGDSKDKDATPVSLHSAVRMGNTDRVRLLLENGADIMVRDEDGWTALHHAASKGHEQVVQLLLGNGAEIMAKNKSGWAALHYAARNGHERVAQLLLENGADIMAKDGFERTALHHAARNGHKGVVQLLLENWADISTPDKDKRTALHYAAGRGREEVVQLLLENGADIMEREIGGWTALHLAASNGHAQMVQLLIESGADIIEREKDEWKALHLAASNGRAQVVQLLIESGADIIEREKDEWKALHLAASNGHAQVVQLLIENGVDIIEREKDEWKALHLAACNGHEQVVQLLIENGADIMARGEGGWTALHVAAGCGLEQVMQLLIENGADIMAREEDEWTALHFAANGGREQAVQLLIENGADIMARGEGGWTALHLAADKGHEKVVQLLLEHGAEIMAREGDEWTALHLAANKGHEQVVQLLLGNGADIMARGKDERTALHLATSKGHEQAVQLLLEYGADITTGMGNRWAAL